MHVMLAAARRRSRRRSHRHSHCHSRAHVLLLSDDLRNFGLPASAWDTVQPLVAFSIQMKGELHTYDFEKYTFSLLRSDFSRIAHTGDPPASDPRQSTSSNTEVWRTYQGSIGDYGAGCSAGCYA